MACMLHLTRRVAGGGLLQRTRVVLFWPVLLRIASGVAVIALQSLWDAHREEAAKLMKEWSANDMLSSTQLTPKEALEVLNMDSATRTPLSGENRAVARRRFEVLFAKAQQAQSPYLQGKVSGAYRALVDPVWDSQH